MPFVYSEQKGLSAFLSAPIVQMPQIKQENERTTGQHRSRQKDGNARLCRSLSGLEICELSSSFKSD